MTPFIQITTMTDSAEEAGKIAATLVRERLAACAQVFGPAVSTYWWEGEIEEATEWECVVKTREALYERVEARIRSLHSYEVAAILAVPVVRGSTPYLEWISAEVEDG